MMLARANEVVNSYAHDIEHIVWWEHNHRGTRPTTYTHTHAHERIPSENQFKVGVNYLLSDAKSLPIIVMMTVWRRRRRLMMIMIIIIVMVGALIIMYIDQREY